MTISKTNKLHSASNLQQLINEVGEADSQYRLSDEANAHLSLRRARLRMELIQHTSSPAEKVFFLTEAAGILELLLMNAEKVEQALQASLLLAKVYLNLYKIQKNKAYLKITEQLLKNYSQSNDPHVFWLLAISSAYQKFEAMTRHWLEKHLLIAPLPEEWWSNDAFTSILNTPSLIKIKQMSFH